MWAICQSKHWVGVLGVNLFLRAVLNKTQGALLSLINLWQMKIFFDTKAELDHCFYTCNLHLAPYQVHEKFS